MERVGICHLPEGGQSQTGTHDMGEEGLVLMLVLLCNSFKCGVDEFSE